MSEQTLPPWVTPYLPKFREVHHAISLSEGFSLSPIAVPSAELARALSAWLNSNDIPTVSVEPDGDTAWRELASTLLDTTPSPSGAVMVIGPRDPPEGIRTALRVVNERRDRIAGHLKRPLLWCSPRTFFDVTWRAAPDFWSIADVPVSIEPPDDVLIDSTADYTGREIREPPEELRPLYDDAKAHEDARVAARLGLRLADALALRSQFQEARRVAQDVFVRAEHAHEARLAGLAKQMLGRLALSAGRVEEAEANLREAREAGQLAGDPVVEAGALLLLGDTHVGMRRLENAQEEYGKALKLFRTLSDSIGEAQALKGLGDVDAHEGRYGDAETHYETALGAFRKLGEHLGEANTLVALGDLRARRDRFTDAETSYTQALGIFRRLGARYGEAGAQRALGDLHARAGLTDKAYEAYDAALKLFQAVSASAGEARTNVAMGRLLARTGQPADAEDRYHRAAALFGEINDRVGVAHTFNLMGDLRTEEGRAEDAGRAYHKAYRALRYSYSDADTLRMLAETSGPINPSDEPRAEQVASAAVPDTASRQRLWYGAAAVFVIAVLLGAHAPIADNVTWFDTAGVPFAFGVAAVGPIVVRGRLGWSIGGILAIAVCLCGVLLR